MKDSKSLFRKVIENITLQIDPAEIKTIAFMLLEEICGLTRTDILADKMINVSPEARQLIDMSVARINRHEPIQYVLGKALFYGRTFKVNPSVLIPRPETEELVHTVLEWKRMREHITADQSVRILDIGTGSGCIPVTLFLEWPEARVFALDVSPDAIAVAKANAEFHRADVTFMEHDFLKGDIPFGNFDIIVSNPPYIAESEKSAIPTNVLMFEPHLALFAPGDPLIFYRAIATKGRSVMNDGGLLALEINERYGSEVCALLIDHGWDAVKLVRDLSGKPRIVNALKG